MSGNAANDLLETLEWIKDWRDGMFSSTSRDKDGWPIEMHGLAASYELLAAELDKARSARDGWRERFMAMADENARLRSGG